MRPESKLLIGPSGMAVLFSVPEMFGSALLLDCLKLIRSNMQHSREHNACKVSKKIFATHGGFACKEIQVSAPMKIPPINSHCTHNNSRAAVMTANHKSSNYKMPFCTQSLLADIRIISRIQAFMGFRQRCRPVPVTSE